MTLLIGNAQGFWGDRPDAAFQLAKQMPEIDYITLDYLAEVSMSILAGQRKKNPLGGFARDFVDVVRQLVPLWEKGADFKVISNAGGLDPLACGRACREALGDLPLKIAVVLGDDVIQKLIENSDRQDFSHLENRESLTNIVSSLATANVYLGAEGICKALAGGANIVITGRVADPSMTVAAAMFHYQWPQNAWDKIAGATVAGHLIECGTQVTGGISTDWLNIDDIIEIGFPIVDIAEDGSFIITKAPWTGGAVTLRTVKEQILYELGDPENYLSPDATVSFTHLQLSEQKKDHIHVSGAIGRPPPKKFKVSATYEAGWKAEAMLAIFGRNLRRKSFLCGQVVKERLKNLGFDPEEFLCELLGGGDLVPGVYHPENPLEGVMRFAIKDRRREAVEKFIKEIAPLVTSGPQGITGYMSGRPKVRQAYGFWPCLIPREEVPLEVIYV